MFWKKKIETKEPKYVCKGINYLKVIEVDGENLDQVKEELFTYFEKQKKIYTRTDIDTMTSKLGYDIWNSFIWVDEAVASTGKMNISVLYRWIGTNEEIQDEETFKIVKPALDKHLDLINFYTRAEIEKVSMKVGFSVFDRSKWRRYTQITLNIPTLSDPIIYYQKTK